MRRFVVREVFLAPPHSGGVWHVAERRRSFPLAVETYDVLLTFLDHATAVRVADLLEQQYLRGVLDGVARFAWWKDGCEYVGTTGTTLKDALADVRKEHE